MKFYSAALFIFLIVFAATQTFCQIVNPGPAGLIEDGGGTPPYLGAPQQVFVQGNFAYVASSTTHSLEIIDITLPGAPVHKGSLTSGNNRNLTSAKGLYVAGNYAYLISGDNDALVIADISDPANPVFKGATFFQHNFFVYGGSVFVKGNYAFVTSGSTSSSLNNIDLAIVDVSNPSAPVQISNSGTVPTTGLNFAPKSVFVSGKYAYVINYSQSQLKVIDVSKPAAPSLKASITHGGGGVVMAGPMAIYVHDSTAYITSRGSNSLEIIKYSKGSLSHVGSITTGSGGALLGEPYSIFVRDTLAYVGAHANNALQIVNIKNPALPKPAGSLTDGTNGALIGGPLSTFVSGNYAYVVSEFSNSFEVVDITTPKTPVHKANLSTGIGGPKLNTPRSVAIKNNYAFVASLASNALEVIDVTDSQNPIHKSSLSNGDKGAYLNAPAGIAVSGQYAYIINSNVASNKAMLQVVDISNPADPIPVGQLLSNYPASAIAIADTLAYIITTNSFNQLVLNVVNISSPASPILTTPSLTETTLTFGAVIQSFGKYNSIAVSGKYAYVIASSSLNVIDISVSPPSHKFKITGGASGAQLNGASSVFVSGNYAYIASYGSNALEIIDLSPLQLLTPSTPVHAASYSSSYLNGPICVAVSGNYAYIGNYAGSSLEVVDVSKPASPLHYRSLLDGQNGAIMSIPNSIAISGNYAYVLNNSGAMQIVSLYSPNILSFSPMTGAEDSQVTITGENFDSFLAATFNGPSAGIVSVSPTSAVVTVPVGAQIGKISISDRSVAIPSAANFIVVPKATASSNFQQTSFTANWSNVSAQSYYLDVSTDNNFSTFVAGYNNLNVQNVTTYPVTGLSPGVLYYFRVRSSDGSSNSVNSNTIPALTIPATPTLGKPTLVTQSSFTFSWNAITGATSYTADVATDESFNSPIGNYDSIRVTGTTLAVNALSSGTTYYCRLRSANVAGSSPSSLTLVVVTLPANPVTTEATAIGTTGFTANWLAAAGATGYSIDISTDNFATLVSGFGNLSVGANTSINAVLSSGTSYQYRVRASNDFGVSGNSNITSVLTLTPTPSDQPTNLLFSNITGTSVNISYTSAKSNPSGYIVLRSAGSSVAVPPSNGMMYTVGAVIGNATVAYVGSLLSFFDGGLPSSVQYYYGVYSYNGSGVAINYLTTTPLQGNVILDVNPPQVSAPVVPNPATITAGNTPIFNATITDNVSVASASIFYRGISKKAFNSAPLSLSGPNNYSVQIQTTWYDSLGLEYYFMATDQSGNSTARPPSNFAHVVNTSVTLPSLPSGSGQGSYRIVSFPYQLSTDNNITTVYNNVSWNDFTKASLWWWNPSLNGGVGDYDRYGKSATLKTIDPGKGYWIITRDQVTPQLSNVPAPQYNTSNLFSMTLKPGWNQIGNPYPVPISWDNVISLNQKINPAASFSSLSVYDGASIKAATNGTLLKPYEGGFVKNLTSSDITIQIPFNGQTTIGGRNTSISSDLTQDAWKIFLHIRQDGIINQLGGFGMHPLAKSGEDDFDNFNPPQFLEVPEVNFTNLETPGILFSQDMVPTQENFSWRFSPTGTIGKSTELNWSPDISVNSNKQLFLFDEENLSIIDMRAVSSYSFSLTGKSRFKIFYGHDVENKITSDEIAATNPFPNPLMNELKTSINIALPETKGDYSVRLQFFSLQGEQLDVVNQILPSGIHKLDLAIADRMSSEILIYKLQIVSPTEQKSFTGKIIKQ